jgi:hypothetical protein
VDIDELHHQIGPHQVTIHRVRIRKHAPRQALADDHRRFRPVTVHIVEVSAGNQWCSQRRKEGRSDHAKLCAVILLAWRRYASFHRECKA